MAGARLRLQETDFPDPEEELGIPHECPGWQHCALCRSTRLGAETLRRARERRVDWRDTNTPMTNPIRDPVPFTTLDDALDSMLQFMTITSRKCRNYHCCHHPHHPGSSSHKHHIRYHSVAHDDTLTSPPAKVQVNTLPGNYTITAARWGSSNSTTKVVTLDPNKSVTMTMTV